MTPGQLDRLAEQSEFAAGFYVITDPAAARRFADAAQAARRLSEQLERQQQLSRLRADLADVRTRLNRRQRHPATAVALGAPAAHPTSIGRDSLTL